MSLILDAARFAAAAHGSQKRRNTNRPYIEHPARVAAMAAIHPDATEAMVAAAFLHDVLEDTPTTGEELESRFGHEVASVVARLTHPPKTAGNRARRQQLYREQLVASSHQVRVIKMLDRLDNLREMAGDDPGFIKLYAEESVQLAEAIGDADQALATEIRALAGAMLRGK